MEIKSLPSFIAAGAKLIAQRNNEGFLLKVNFDKCSSYLLSQRGNIRTFKSLDTLAKTVKNAGCNSLEVRLNDYE